MALEGCEDFALHASSAVKKATRIVDHGARWQEVPPREDRNLEWRLVSNLILFYHTGGTKGSDPIFHLYYVAGFIFFPSYICPVLSLSCSHVRCIYPYVGVVMNIACKKRLKPVTMPSPRD